MKSFFLTAALAGTSLAIGWLPSCSWSDCMGSWDGSSCTQSSGWDCVCSNTTAIAQINTCVATSCTNATDQETIYGAIAQLCANAGKSVTNSQEATFKATSGGTFLPSVTGAGPGGNWNSAAWASWVSAASTAIGSAPSGWGPGGSWGASWGGPMRTGGPGGPGGPGGWGPGANGPWGTKAQGIACSGTASWTTWTAGWGPFSSWTGIWSGCSSTTATPSPATVTTTITTNGHASVITGTTFGIQALSTTGSSASASKVSAGSSASHVDTSRALLACGGVAAAMLGLMIAL